MHGKVIERCCQNRSSMQDETDQFGVDWEGPVTHEDSDETVCVPETPCPLV